MADDIISKMDFSRMHQLDFSRSIDLTSGIQARIESSNRQMQKIGEEAYENRRRMQEAIEQTAINTGETNAQLQKVVENQNAYIDVLKVQLSTQKQQLELDEQQLAILESIFASGEDGVAVEKEIMEIIQGQIDSSHPLWDYVKDKGGDVLVAGVTTGVPVLYGALKMYLAAKGVLLP